jgi:hypothetical protein
LEKQLKAHDLNPVLLKPPEGVGYRKIQARQTEQANTVVEWIGSFIEPNALVAESNRILDSLAFGVPHNVFEQAFADLAVILGFQSQRPEMETGRGPDILWRMPTGGYLIIEAKNQIEVGRQRIYKQEAEQLGHSVIWFTQTYMGEQYTPVLIHPSSVLADDAFVPNGTKVIQNDTLQKIVERVRNFVSALAAKPTSQWTPTEVAAQIAAHALRPVDFSTGMFTKDIGRDIRR